MSSNWTSLCVTLALALFLSLPLDGGELARQTLAAQAAPQSVTELILVDAQTGADLRAMGEHQTIDLAAARRLNIRAITDPPTVGSVSFSFNGIDGYNVENDAPYAFDGDSRRGFDAWTPAVGSHTIAATPFSEKDGKGVRGQSRTVRLEVVDTSAPGNPMGDGKFLYVVTDEGLEIYDIDDQHRHVGSVKLPELNNVRGAAAHAGAGILYITYNRSLSGPGKMMAYDLNSQKVIWTTRYSTTADSHCITPDGTRIYLPPKGYVSGGDSWMVVDASNGTVLQQIAVGPGPHNTICSLDGTHVYMGAVNYNFLAVADPRTNQVVRRVGPFSEGVRPFTVSASNRYAFVTVNHLVGFEVGDIETGERLFQVKIADVPARYTEETPSHGIALTPDERELWVVDKPHGLVHVFDLTEFPAEAPRPAARVPVDNARWISFDLDGRFAYAAADGRAPALDVIDRTTRVRVAQLAYSKYYLQIDFAEGRSVRAGSRHGLGYATSAAHPAVEPSN